MTVSTGRREITIAYAERELGILMGVRGASQWFPEGERLVRATGIYDNFTVAGGQDVDAWVIKPRKRVLQAAMLVLRAAEREHSNLSKKKANWAPKLSTLIQFLKSSRAQKVRIRHHYAWN